MGFLAALPVVGSLFGGGAAAAGAAGTAAGIGAGAAAGAVGGAAATGSVLTGLGAAASGLSGLAALALRPKVPTAPYTPKPPSFGFSGTGANTSLAAAPPGSLLGGTNRGVVGSASTYGKTLLGG